MRYYIGSKIENLDSVRRIKAVLDERGYVQTYDWTVHGSIKAEGEERLRSVAKMEREAVESADVVIFLLPGGRGMRGELGVAIEAKKPVLMCAMDDTYFKFDENTTPAYWDRGVERCIGTEAEWLQAVDSLRSGMASGG